MTAVILQVVVGVIGLVTLWYKQYQANSPQREKEARDDEIQQGRQDIVSGNVDAVESRIDGLLKDADGSDARVESAEDAQRRLSNL